MSSSETQPIKIKVRLAHGLTSATGSSDLDIQIADSETTTVGDLKRQTKTAGQLNVEPEDIRLIYTGRVFKDDEETLASYGVKDGSTIHASKLARNRAAEEAAQTAGPLPRQPSASGLPDMSALFQNPLVQSILENPEFMRSMLENDPRIARLMEQNPTLRQTFSDPAFLREMLNTMRNPALSQEMMRNVDRQLLNIENIPGGFNALSSMYHDIQGPLSEVRDDEPSTDEANRRFASMLGAQRSSSEGINNEALPNPWAPPATSTATNSFPSAMGNSLGALPFPNIFPQPSLANPSAGTGTSQPSQPFPPFGFDLGTMMQQIQQMQSAFQLPQSSVMPPTVTSSTAPERQATTQSHEERFADQLRTLREMGFGEKDKCLRALLAAGGNVEAAIAYLLDSP